MLKSAGLRDHFFSEAVADEILCRIPSQILKREHCQHELGGSGLIGNLIRTPAKISKEGDCDDRENSNYSENEPRCAVIASSMFPRWAIQGCCFGQALSLVLPPRVDFGLVSKDTGAFLVLVTANG